MIPKALLAFAVALSLGAPGEERCRKQCDETVRQCKDMCKKQLEKTQPDKVAFCQGKCKEFTNECYKTCKDGKHN
ncbi:MAG: hypothetical protein AB1938_14245 [Myxococcota bacterium]